MDSWHGALYYPDNRTELPWWSWGDSNPLPHPCKGCALPDELQPHISRQRGVGSAAMSIDSNAAAQTVSFHYTLPGARTKGTIGEGCLLLVLIGFSTLERAVPRTPRCRPFFELAGGRRLSTFIEENQEIGFRFDLPRQPDLRSGGSLCPIRETRLPCGRLGHWRRA